MPRTKRPRKFASGQTWAVSERIVRHIVSIEPDDGNNHDIVKYRNDLDEECECSLGTLRAWALRVRAKLVPDENGADMNSEAWIMRERVAPAPGDMIHDESRTPRSGGAGKG